MEAKDDGPDETEDEAMVAIDDVMGAHVLQVDPLLLEELQGLVHIFQTVDTHASLGGFWLTTERKEKDGKEIFIETRVSTREKEMIHGIRKGDKIIKNVRFDKRSISPVVHQTAPPAV